MTTTVQIIKATLLDTILPPLPPNWYSNDGLRNWYVHKLEDAQGNEYTHHSKQIEMPKIAAKTELVLCKISKISGQRGKARNRYISFNCEQK